MEKAQVQKQFTYKENANLVLSVEGRSRDLGPSSEVESLTSKKSVKDLMKEMGDRASVSKPLESDRAIEAERAKKRAAVASADGDAEVDLETAKTKKKFRQRTQQLESVLTGDIEYVYRPQTKETRAVYETLLNLIQTTIGDRPHDVLVSMAEEVLSILKEDTVTVQDQREELNSLFKITGVSKSSFDDEKFRQFVNVSKKITDYKKNSSDGNNNDNSKHSDDKIDGITDVDVAVVFDDEKDEKGENANDNGDSLDLIKEDSDDEDENNELLNLAKLEDNDMNLDENEKSTNSTDESEIMYHSIDAHWIQRQLSVFYSDPIACQKLAEQVFQLLNSPVSDAAVENKLVSLLEFERFQFVKLLVKHRVPIVWAIKLARASKEDRIKIQEEMNNDPQLAIVLDKINRVDTEQDRAAQLEKRLNREAKNIERQTKTVDSTQTALNETSGKGAAVDSRSNDAFWNIKPSKLVDLESLTFDKGAHTMTNQQVALPKGSEVVNKKGYQEVHVPPLAPTPMAESETIVEIERLPAWARPAFKGMTSLNRVQSQVCNIALNTAENLLLCAPTGAGKTNVAMLTMLREIGLHIKDDGTVDLDAFKIVYVAPMKALVQEVVSNFTRRLEPYNLTVRELSGDVQLSKEQIASTQVIVTTPEKWDIITRKAGERAFTQQVKLVIIDEIHLLHDTRGPVLEAIVARTIRQVEQTQELIRLVGLSATLPNYKDVALFLRVKFDRGLFFFNSSFRPVPLQQQYIGMTQKKAFKRDQLLNEIAYEKMIEQVGRKQLVLIFVHSRKDTANTARFLRDMALERDELNKFVQDASGRAVLLRDEAANVKNASLKDLLPHGFAIHHAGMNRSDRQRVEELFADNHIQVLVSTATLAWGVNLPAHAVIIKGTQVYDPEKGGWSELSPLDVGQMLGRAGRPQYDTQGEGIIITSQKELHFYLSLINAQLPVESQLISKLPDMLNAEIVLGTITNMKDAVRWLGYTYLYVRMLRTPHTYGIDEATLKDDPYLDQRRADLIHSAATTLDKSNLIKYDRKSGAFQVTDLGRVASHYYITHTSMAVYNVHLKPNMSDIELFRVFSLSNEFRNITVREEEKNELAGLLDKVPIPVKESIDEPTSKVNVLLQAYISRLNLEGFALTSDMVYITQSAGRICRAIFEILLKRGWASATMKALNLCKMVQHRMWTAQSPLRQFSNIPNEVIKRIEGKELPWDRFYDLEAPAIGELIRFPKMGKPVYKAVHQLPRVELRGQVQPITRTTLKVELTITPDFAFDDKIHGATESFWIMVEDTDSETILHHQFFQIPAKFSEEEQNISFTIPVFEPLPPQYFIRFVSDRWLGSEVLLPISFRHLILPEKYAPPTDLLDLQPTPVTDLMNEKAIAFFQNRFNFFNPIQTQVFNTVYRKSDNFFVAAPTSSGKTVIAELAILRMLSSDPNARCVYVAPLESLANERFQDWSVRFKKIGVNVVQLAGETTADVKMLGESQIAIATPTIWDILSRRWKSRKQVTEIKLFIIDELHLVGGSVGPVIEVIVSRMRFIASQNKVPMRLAGLSTSVANAKDLGEWIGASSNATFNFHPNVRPVPLEIRISSFDQTDFHARQLAMIKPAYNQLNALSPDLPAIFFVPGKTQANQVSLDFMAFAASEDKEFRFVHKISPKQLLDELKPHISNPVLLQCLAHGVGLYHNGLSATERNIVEELFKSGRIQIIVSEYSLAWGMSMVAHLVVMMGVNSYDSLSHRYVDIPITDVIQMMGRASRPLIDTVGHAVLMCPTPKKEFYKKFLYQPFPVESHLDTSLADHLNAEIITKRIQNVQDAVDYLTWSFLYRRLTQNPNYYNLAGTSHRHFSDHLSELVETTLNDLATAKCIQIEDETELSPLNLGMIAAYYYLKYTTVEIFSNSLQKKTKLKGLLEILSAASEFDTLIVRPREDSALRDLARHLPVGISPDSNFSDPHIKVNILLQSHFSRISLTASVESDIAKLLPDASRLLLAMVDVLSSSEWLAPALGAMELSQMVTQAMWNTDPVLLQVPHFDKELVQKAKAVGVNTVADMMDMDDEERLKLLKDLTESQIADVATFCNSYPDIAVEYKFSSKSVEQGEAVTVQCSLERDDEDFNGIPIVIANRYPGKKSEAWWIVIGKIDTNELLAIKRVQFNKPKLSVQLDFTAPTKIGSHDIMCYVMSDSYVGIDQEFKYEINVTKKEGQEEEQDKEAEDNDENKMEEEK